VAWVAQAYETTARPLLALAVIAMTLFTVAAIWINRLAYRRIRELENL
jgi:cbb3-type cytochrome oxidase subunit 3